MSEESKKEDNLPELEEMEQTMLEMHGDVFHQLMQHDRFRLFLDANYDIQLVKNEEEKTVRYVVMQNSSEKASEIMLELAQEMQKQSPNVQVADASVLKALEKTKNGQ